MSTGSRNSVISQSAQRLAEASEAARLLYNSCFLNGWMLFQSAEERGPPEHFFRASPSVVGLALQSSPGVFAFEPATLEARYQKAASAVGSTVFFTMCSETSASIFNDLHHNPSDVIIRAVRHNLPVLNSLDDLCTGGSEYNANEAFACLIKQDQVVVIAVPSTVDLIPFASDVSLRLTSMLKNRLMQYPITRPPMVLSSPSAFSLSSQHRPALPAYNSMNSYASPAHTSVAGSSSASSIANFKGEQDFNYSREKNHIFESAFRVEDGDVYDPEVEGNAMVIRRMALTRTFGVSLAMVLVFLVQGVGVSVVIEESLWDGQMLRLALLALCPLLIMMSLFFFSIVTTSAFQVIGPIFDVNGNTKYHSAKPPNPARHRGLDLPHITVQIPIYKEGLKGVIAPTIVSIQAAVRYYESRGGSASIFVCEDGMQVIKPELAEARKLFYSMNNIGWCARPPHNKDGYVRAGQFKKASNMNYSTVFSIKVEEKFFELRDEKVRTSGMSIEELVGPAEDALYKQALDMMIEADEGRTQAAGNLRIGEYILIVDSDTRVPIDCLLTGALEMHESPEVAILQHTSGVMNVTGSAFENGIAYFTDLVYGSIKYCVGSGDFAPFVGHNAILRWKALESIAFEEDGQIKYWTDSHVSEDFQLALRLQIKGSIVRLASYHSGDFKEGVSLTVFDELLRWQKYAYGCNELIFNPVLKWYKGPFTSLFLKFLWSSIKPTSKLNIVAYMSTYYAIASALPITVVNYCLVGWFSGEIDKFYTDSWRVLVAIIMVFSIIGPFAFAVAQHRMGHKRIFPALWQNVKYIPMLMLFFSGISLHMLSALFCHFFGIKREWGSTAKEIEASGFFIGLEKIVKDFKYMYIILMILTAGIVYTAIAAPTDWRITNWAAIVPLAVQIAGHFLSPVILGLN